MKIESLEIQNFRGVRYSKLDQLESMVVIAGTNGSGKSTIFDAIRLLKSVYGSPSNNEPDQWFGEFQMPITNKPAAFERLFNDKSKPLKIEAQFSLSDSEKRFLRDNADKIVEDIVVDDATNTGKFRTQNPTLLSRRFREQDPNVAVFIGKIVAELRSELERETHLACFSISPGALPQTTQSRVLEVQFSALDPANLGGLRYHSAQRNYAREQLRNVSINIVDERSVSQSSYLYGNAQYSNIKQEMATAYVKELVANDAGLSLSSRSTLKLTLDELFRRFLPDKTFLGAKPTVDGTVTFPVKIGEDTEHDLDELSSGEKEIVYGYLRMRNSSPGQSVILIDEPELHLNPLLIGGLPEFYHKHLGSGLGNQIWLVTHSDTLLRASVGRADYAVFHMVPQASAEAGSNQAARLKINEAATNAFHDLVGDWAAFRPGAKLVIFEGGGSTEFDVSVTGALFPNERTRMNFLSAGSRRDGQRIHSAIEMGDSASDIQRKVFSIADRDSGDDVSVDNEHRFIWDRYHIENYLLDFDCIAAVGQKLLRHHVSTDQVESELRAAAASTTGRLVRHQLMRYVRKSFGDVLDVSVNAQLESISTGISQRISSVAQKLDTITENLLTPSSLADIEAEARSRYASDLSNGEWIVSHKGRDILRKYIELGELQNLIVYDSFVNLIVDEMVLREIQPPGMKRVMDKISDA